MAQIHSYLPWAFFFITNSKNVLWLATLLWVSQWKNLFLTLLWGPERLLSRVLAARVVCTRRGGGSTHCYGWQADWSYNCTLIPSQVAGFTIIPHSHGHGPTRDPQRSTTFTVSETGSSAMLSSYIHALHFQALWSSDSENHQFKFLERNKRLRGCFFYIFYSTHSNEHDCLFMKVN